MFVCVHVCPFMCVCVHHVMHSVFNGYMLLNIIETGLPLDTLYLTDERLGIAGSDAFKRSYPLIRL